MSEDNVALLVSVVVNAVGGILILRTKMPLLRSHENNDTIEASAKELEAKAEFLPQVSLTISDLIRIINDQQKEYATLRESIHKNEVEISQLRKELISARRQNASLTLQLSRERKYFNTKLQNIEMAMKKYDVKKEK